MEMSWNKRKAPKPQSLPDGIGGTFGFQWIDSEISFEMRHEVFTLKLLTEFPVFLYFV
jgi:hypothetical protein